MDRQLFISTRLVNAAAENSPSPSLFNHVYLPFQCLFLLDLAGGSDKKKRFNGDVSPMFTSGCGYQREEGVYIIFLNEGAATSDFIKLVCVIVFSLQPSTSFPSGEAQALFTVLFFPPRLSFQTPSRFSEA